MIFNTAFMLLSAGVQSFWINLQLKSGQLSLLAFVFPFGQDHSFADVHALAFSEKL